MSDWTWALLDAQGAAAGPDLAGQVFPTQSEAESWLGEEWRGLLDAGVDAVTLHEDGVVVYGPMSLHPTQ